MKIYSPQQLKEIGEREFRDSNSSGRSAGIRSDSGGRDNVRILNYGKNFI